ncbi:zinc finger BED domain-containing protein 4-like [Dermacentor silvarum]|uniref:zinc finger BED domain-containing protein 4-like n=1 Tax=Dermacentor silvarum TaxID=543639 RepID=UPI0021010087|nr:zinc finger BED domain-containing protein 4-like [Dermacentor silvarum]
MLEDQPVEQSVAGSVAATGAETIDLANAAISPRGSVSSSFAEPMEKCLSSAMVFARGGVREKLANDALGYMIAHDDLPLSTPEKDGFKTFVKALQPLYEPPSESTVAMGLEAKYEELRAHYGRIIQEADHLNLTADFWTHESTMRSYLGLIVHFREGNKLVNVEIGVKYVPERKTSMNLRVAMRELCDEWNIDYKKVRAVVTDGGQYIKAAVREEFGADKHISCVAHLLNQVGQAAIGLAVSKAPSELEAHEFVVVPENEQDAEALLEDVPDADDADDDGTPLVNLRPLLTKVKRIVRFFRTSDVASRTLMELQLQDGKQEPDALKLIQEVRTRWNSCYYMLERFLQLSEPVSRVLLHLLRERGATRRKPPNLISGDQLDVLGEVKDLLKPLEEATLMVSKGRSVTLGDVIPMVYGLKQGIRNFQPSHPVAFNLQQKLLSEVNARFSGIEYTRPYAAATILDPRYKKYVFEDPQAVAMIVQHLTVKDANQNLV